MSEKKETYGAESIKVLEGLEGVRRRPAMYIGSTGKEGLHHLVYEAVDNSVDEALAGFCNKIDVSLNEDGSATIEDDGRGIPIEKSKQYGVPAVEIALTKLHAGGKFDKKSYAISGGLHGVGISCVNALSKKLVIEIKKNGKIYRQEFSIGKKKSELKVVGKCASDISGTKITFYPDPDIFSTVDFDYKSLETRFREIAFLNAGLKISLEDKKKNKKEEFHYSGGLKEFVKWINESKDILHKPIYFKRTEENIVAEVSIQYNSGYKENIYGFVNTINTVEGGTHVSGFKTALTRVINDYAKRKKILKNDSLNGDDIREGITAIVSIKIPDPQFEGQTKTKLGNSDIKGFVDSIVTVALAEFLEENPSVGKKIASKAMDAAKARLAAKKAKDLVRRKNEFAIGGLPGKLSDCSSKKSENTELYIVEGDSAGGSAKQARDKETQAILPLKGKILNVEKANPSKALSSEEIANIITAMGTGVGENFNLDKLRYHKIVIMTDADVDGEHIKTLLYTFFYRFVPELIENGKIYAAMPPLYRIRKKKDYYVYSEEELKKKMQDLNISEGNITRFKGLGEMSLDQLWDTTMNPKTRKIEKVYIDDAIEADRVFSMLMGENVQARREFIQENAKEADLDV
jgi:DNA gyrase subunit B